MVKGSLQYWLSNYISNLCLSIPRKTPFLCLFKESSCKTKNYTVGAKIDSFMKVQANSASALMKAIAHYGPATASINTEAKTLKFYKSGVYNDKICSEYDFN